MNDLDKAVIWERMFAFCDATPIDESGLSHFWNDMDSADDNYIELLKYCMNRVVGSTNDGRMIQMMKVLLEAGGSEILEQDQDFKRALKERVLIHENQFVVIYEDFLTAEAFLNLYNLLG